MLRQHFRSTAQRASDNISDIVQLQIRRDCARLQARHVEQIGDEAIEPLRLLRDGAEKLTPRRFIERGLIGFEAACGAKYGSKRRAQVVADRSKERGSQPLRLRA